jgi:histidine ammonia-lyase
MEHNNIPIIMEFINNNITEDRRRKYYNALIVKILEMLQIYGISYSQYTLLVLVSENKVLSHPSSVDSIPMSANQKSEKTKRTV